MCVKINGLSLFSGIGGIDVSLSEWVQPVAYCEIEPYCQSVLLQRMQEGDLPKAPIWDDVRTLPYGELPDVDIIYGGFPCQDISVAGHGKGLEGKRSGLFFEIIRLAKEIKPTFIFLENVPAITGRGGLRVVREVAAMGYDCRWCVISAKEVGARHLRKRWFLLGYSEHNGLDATKKRGSVKKTVCNDKKRKNKTSESSQASSPSMLAKIDGNTDSKPSQQTNQETESIQNQQKSRRGFTRQYWPYESRDDWKKTVSEICRVSDGVQNGMDRIKALGNAVVPQQTRKAFQILKGDC